MSSQPDLQSAEDPRRHENEPHAIEGLAARLNWLRAGVLGANDGIVSVAAMVVGVAGATTDFGTLLAAGLAAVIGGAVSMACGTVLTRKWQPPVSLLTITAWQLMAGGLLLVPLAIAVEPATPAITGANMLALVWLGLIGAALTYILWFRGIARLDATAVAPLGFLSPISAVLLGWLFLDQTLTAFQIGGAALSLAGIWLNQRRGRR